MTVAETPVVDHLTFQVYDADAGAWQDLAGYATSVSIRRGAQQKGAGLETQVGTLDAELYGELDLARLLTLRPNVPIRVVRPQLAPALAWDLMPADAADSVASKGVWPRILRWQADNGDTGTSGYGNNVFSDSMETNFGYSDDGRPWRLPAGTILYSSPNTYSETVPNNPKPVGLFDPGATYTLSATIRNRSLAPRRSYRLVVFTGDAESPTIVAQSEPINPPDEYPGLPVSVDFVAPASDDWNVGVALGETVSTAGDRQHNTLVSVFVRDLQVHDHGRERPEFTGTISDVYQSVQLDKSSGVRSTFTTVQAVDAVQSLANTDRYGVISRDGAGFQTWADRIDQLATSALVPIDAPKESAVPVWDQNRDHAWGWLTSHQFSEGNINAQWIHQGGNGSFSVYEWPYDDGRPSTRQTMWDLQVAQRLLYLDPAASYAAVVTIVPGAGNSKLTAPGEYALAWRADDGTMTWGDPINMAGGTQTGRVQFQPLTGNGAVGLFQLPGNKLTIDAGQRFDVKVQDTLVLRVGTADTYALQDVAFESTLLNHFDLACNSVGARWYVTKRGTALFRRAEDDQQPVARFTDTDAGDVSYTDVALAYDTRNVVNTLKLNQHGYDPATGNADDVSSTFTDSDSLQRWGARAGELDTCLYTGSPHQNDLATRAGEVMAKLRTPSYAIQSFTINAQSNPDVLDALELRATVAIDYDTIRQRGRVIGLEHSITPTRWMVTVTLAEPHVGPRFGDVAAELDGLTFAEVNARYAGKTFTDLNLTPFAILTGATS